MRQSQGFQLYTAEGSIFARTHRYHQQRLSPRSPMASANTTNVWAAAGSEFAAQWTGPGDVFSVLLILGGDVVQLALAALTGGSPVTPIAFSFGWVAYAISAMLSAIGDNRLVRCAPEVPVKVFNLGSSYQRPNQSWLLGRLFKTYPYWMSPEVNARLQLSARDDQDRVALCVAVYKWRKDGQPGFPSRDLLWWSGFFVSAVQLGVAAIPFALHKDWAIFLITACGTLLCHASASIPQWRHEKWHARRTKKDVALTLGVGSQHVIIVLGSKDGLDLEDLAAGRAPDMWSTRISTMVLAILWLVLLISCTGIKTNTWYLLAVGGLGMLHNTVVAGAPRRPVALGLPIEPVTTTNDPGDGGGPRAEVFAEQKVMWTLVELEKQYNGFGKALLEEFFPGKLRGWEVAWWESTDPNQRRQLLQQAKDDERVLNAGRRKLTG
ncbi:hypothetical protein BDV95DRAFT_567605 [Massariosphaeria phaeospora]|uniref:Uncharacterized protein n=1 Tax=Massariosphaeria phaeospora TaxID=100035 RepID=A0A7C8ICH6_9PLEO|nr:hypothetical protein BDV95DRAFT_567605 [Massariosphaeria phaeospora]